MWQDKSAHVAHQYVENLQESSWILNNYFLPRAVIGGSQIITCQMSNNQRKETFYKMGLTIYWP